MAGHSRHFQCMIHYVCSSTGSLESESVTIILSPRSNPEESPTADRQDGIVIASKHSVE